MPTSAFWFRGPEPRRQGSRDRIRSRTTEKAAALSSATAFGPARREVLVDQRASGARVEMGDLAGEVGLSIGDALDPVDVGRMGGLDVGVDHRVSRLLV